MKFDIIAKTRNLQGTSASRRLRGTGLVPAIVYGEGQAAVSIELDHKALLLNLRHETFHSSVLTLSIDGKAEPVLLRDVQVHPVRVQVLHVDFQRVDPTHKIHLKVPVHFLNADTAPGVKLQHGIASHVLTEIEVICLPANLPEFISVDMGNMNAGEAIHLSQMTAPAGVEFAVLHGGADATVCTIISPKGGATDEAPAA
jgi:large subunit ribosomal protein L25